MVPRHGLVLVMDRENNALRAVAGLFPPLRRMKPAAKPTREEERELLGGDLLDKRGRGEE